MAGKRHCMQLASLPQPQPHPRNWGLILLITSFLVSHNACMVAAAAHGDGVTQESLQVTAQRLSQFVEKLPSLRVLKGYRVSSEGSHSPANLTIGMYMKSWKFHRDLPPSRVFAYGESAETATVPGPSIVALGGIKTYIKWENHLPDKHIFTIDKSLEQANSARGIPTVVHLHGSVSEPPSDGNAQAWFTRDYQEKGAEWKNEVYVYDNVRTTSNMWYHDHALGYTRLNLLAGLVGPYKVIDPAREEKLGLPTKKFDRQLVVMDRAIAKSGYLYMNSTGNNPDLHPQWQPEYFGDVIIVNGKAWPHLTVQRRKYRFRIINASNARFYRFALDDGMGFTQIGADSFYLEVPVHLKSVLVAPSEIVDIVIDFSQSKKSSVILINDAAYPFPDGDAPNEMSGKVMKFLIKEMPVADKARIPGRLGTVVKLSEKDAVASRHIVLFEFDSPSEEPTHLLINFAFFNAPVTEFPRHGTTEIWHIVNLTPDNHPFHIHVAAFQVIREQKLKDTDELSACATQNKGITACNLENYMDGTPTPPPQNEGGWKNVYKMQPYYVTSILVRFSLIDLQPFPFDPSVEPGYAYHCHILDHEDNSMMRPYKIVL